MKQLNIFELTRPKYKITKPIRLIELFASYNAIHNTNFEVQTYSFPCQELSINKCKEKKRKESENGND